MCGEHDIIDVLQNYLNEAQYINDEEIWVKVFDYVKKKNMNKRFNRMSCNSFKNYFIKTSARLLNKFSKKISYKRN